MSPPGPPVARASPADLGIAIGVLPTGPGNAITDVPGILVGHSTVWRDEPDPPAGRGVARTGVTAIVPGSAAGVMAEPLRSGVAVLNGAGELTSAIQVRELGWLETPIVLTSTMQVGRAWDGLIELLCEVEPRLGLDNVVIPMVGECDDSWLNDARRTQISVDDVRTAVLGAGSGPVDEGAVGAGTGMICFGWKGGIGTASRQVGGGFTVGVLLLTNFGTSPHLTVAGVPVGRTLRPPPGTEEAPEDAGSCIERSRPPTRRAPRRTSSGWRGGSGWGSPAPARWPTTAAGRSSPPSAPCPPAVRSRSTTAGWTRCSRPWSRRRRRRW